MSIAYMNGQYLPLEALQVSVMDRGFMLGDGVYEVIPVYQGIPFRVEEHLQRLKFSLEAIKLALDCESLSKIPQALIHKNDFQERQLIYLQITRGFHPIRDLHIPSEVHPTIFATCIPLPKNRENESISAITLNDIRWGRCDIKSINLLANILMRRQAEDRGAEEAIMVREGLVLEGTSTNLFIVKNHTLYTPKLGPYLLGGITRKVILELAAIHQIIFHEKDIPVEMLKEADEIWLTNSIKGILSVTTLDGEKVGGGVSGPLYRQMAGYYDELISLRK